MHIPDGMLTNQVVAAAGATSAGFVAYAVNWMRRVDQRKVVLMAVMAALVFALQMLNFPVAGGTSGHFAGGAAAAIMLGPWPAVLVLTTVLLVQALVFADGGVLALGANVLNMGVIAPFVAYATYLTIRRLSATRISIAGAAFVAAWCAVVASSLAAAAQIWLAGRAPLALVGGAMGFWHALIGIGEGVITAGLVSYVYAQRPDLVLGEDAEKSGRGLAGVVVGLAIIAAAATGLSFLASGNPDGLEFVYFEQGIGAPFEEVRIFDTPFSDYLLPGLGSEAVATVLAGLVGAIIAGAFLWGAISAARRRRGDGNGAD